MDFINFAQELYSKPPAAPNSIQLDLSESSEKPTLENLFEEFCIILGEGFKTFFSTSTGKVDLDTLRSKDFEKIREYFLSFGINVFFDMQNLGTKINRKAKPTELKDYKLTLTTPNYIYVIWFDNYIVS